MGNFWSYPNAIEFVVLLVIVFDVIWHMVSEAKDVKRDEEREQRAIQREEDAEKRQIRREHEEIIRKHWQELQSNLISLHRIASEVTRINQFVQEHKNSQDPTSRHLLEMVMARLPGLLSELSERWGSVVAQLNVFPEPRDPLALEVLVSTEELGKTVGDKSVEIKEETLKALADLSKRVAEPGTLPKLDD
jgi:hypothetical protein